MVAHTRVAQGVAETSIPQRTFNLAGLLVVVTLLALGISLLVISFGQARETARRVQCSNNLKQIGLGIQNYHDIRQELPPSYLTDDHSSLALPGGFITWPLVIMPFQSCSNEYDRIELATPLDQAAPSPAGLPNAPNRTFVAERFMARHINNDRSNPDVPSSEPVMI